MVYVELNGRLGNNMFQVATAATLAEKNNCRFAVVCHEKYLLNEPDNCTIYEYIQQFKNTIFKDVTIITNEPESCHYYIQEGSLYQPINYCNNIYLSGTFQSERFFDKDLVRKLFEIPSDLKEKLLQKYGHFLSKGVTSIHVRRLDYIRLPHRYNVPSMNYFLDAINFIGKDSSFFVISDDIKWCRKNFDRENFFFAENNTPLEDMYLQTLCKNNIISNSTFSWWGAWLNSNPEKIVIAPKPWYGKTFSYIPVDDLIPQGWVQIKNRMELYLRLKSFRIRGKDFLRSKYYFLRRELGI